MKKSWLAVSALALVLAMVVLAGCSATGGVSGQISALNISSQQTGISVNGLGEASAVPDIATLRLGIEARESSVAAAQASASEAMDKVMNALTDNGIAEKDIQTQQFSINRVTSWDPEKQEEVVIGYQVTNMVTVKIREIDKAGAIIDGVAAAGGNLTRIDSISFSVEDPTSYYAEAREEAMADAKAKAQQLADDGGVKLGNPIFISEYTQSAPIFQRGIAVAEEAAMETAISPGELDIILTVQVTYAIE